MKCEHGKDRSSILMVTIKSKSQDLVTETKMRKEEEYVEPIEEFF